MHSVPTKPLPTSKTHAHPSQPTQFNVLMCLLTSCQCGPKTHTCVKCTKHCYMSLMPSSNHLALGIFPSNTSWYHSKSFAKATAPGTPSNLSWDGSSTKNKKSYLRTWATTSPQDPQFHHTNPTSHLPLQVVQSPQQTEVHVACPTRLMLLLQLAASCP